MMYSCMFTLSILFFIVREDVDMRIRVAVLVIISALYFWNWIKKETLQFNDHQKINEFEKKIVELETRLEQVEDHNPMLKLRDILNQTENEKEN